MKRFAYLAAVVLALSMPAALCAQTPDPDATPTPDPHTYNDLAMSFTAPAAFQLVGRRTLAIAELTDKLQPAAGWILHPESPDDTRVILLEMEKFGGDTSAWEGQFESDAHTDDSTLIKDKEPMKLSNGMPAYFMEVSTGEGLESKKRFAIVWSDGTRGVALSEIGKFDLKPEEAKRFLKNVSAVQYPLNRI